MVNGSGNDRLILIVDDTLDSRELLVNWLELHGYRTIQAVSGEEALAQAIASQPDLILLDIMMPRMDGMEVCRQLKADERTADIPVIMVTGKPHNDARAKGIFAGAVDYITKPINLQDLVHRVGLALATDPEAPIDTQRLATEVAHTALTIIEAAFVWLLALDPVDDLLTSQIIAASSGSRDEAEFLRLSGHGQKLPRYPLNDNTNILCATLLKRHMAVNVPISQLAASESTAGIAKAVEHLRLSAVTIVPLIAAGKAAGVMVVGSRKPQAEMNTPRLQQILISLASQAATVLDYGRLMKNLREREAEREMEQAFQQMILDTMSDALVVIDTQGMIQFVNRRLLRMTGYPPQHLEGRSVGELFHPDDRRDVMIGLLRENASTMKFDQRLITQDGEVIEVLLSRSHSRSGNQRSQVLVLTDITLQKQREEALERQARQLMALNKASQTIASNLSLHETLKDILHSAMSVVEAEGASLFLVNPGNSNELIVVAAVGHRAEYFVGLRVPFGEGIAGWVAREARSQLVANTQADPRFYHQVDEQSGTSTHSLLVVPMIHAEQVIGVIELVNKLNNSTFDNDDVRLLESMAGSAAVSIVNARLFDQAQRRVAELATLLGTSEAASSTLELANVLEHVARSLLESLEVARCIVTAWNPDRQRLEALADAADAYWLDATGPTQPLHPGTLAGDVVISGRPILASTGSSVYTSTYQTILDSTAVPAILVIPLQMKNSTVGLVTLYSAPDGPLYTDQQTAVAFQISIDWMNSIQMDGGFDTLDVRYVTGLARRLLAEVPGTCWVHVETVDHESGIARMLCEIGLAEWTSGSGSVLPVDNYPTLRAVVEQQHIDIMLQDNLPEDSAERLWLDRHGGDVCLLVPLINKGITIGAFLLIDQNRDTFDNQELDLAQGIANVVSSALENARLYESLQQRARALESAYSELQELDRAKDQFIQNVSHELRTPLIHVLGYAGLLADGTFGPLNDDQQAALQTIAEKGQRVADLVEDMVAAQAQEVQALDLQPVDLSALISNVLTAWDDRINAAHVRLITHFQVGIPPVRADAQLIATAFEKLLDNALKFGTDGGRIEVAIRNTDGPLVQVAVRDYGIGIPVEEQKKIFQRFYQVDGRVNRKYGGAGLGLSVARSIIEGHGGRIGVKSRPTEGSIFFFTLPKLEMKNRKATTA